MKFLKGNERQFLMMSISRNSFDLAYEQSLFEQQNLGRIESTTNPYQEKILCNFGLF